MPWSPEVLPCQEDGGAIRNFALRAELGSPARKLQLLVSQNISNVWVLVDGSLWFPYIPQGERGPSGGAKACPVRALRGHAWMLVQACFVKGKGFTSLQ